MLQQKSKTNSVFALIKTITFMQLNKGLQIFLVGLILILGFVVRLYRFGNPIADCIPGDRRIHLRFPVIL